MEDEIRVQDVYPEFTKSYNGRGRPQRRWRDEVKELLMGSGLSEREGMLLVREREA